MKRYFFAGLVIGAAALYFGWIAFIGLFLGFDLSGDGRFNISPLQSYPSPDGKYGAHVYIHSGGGAAGWCDQFVCVGTSNDFDYSDEYNVFFNSIAQTKIDIEWLDAKTLVITYEISDYTTTIRNQPKRFKDVTVLFNPIQSER